jgi:integrase
MEILQLLRLNFDQEIYPILVVGLNTGLRIGELLGLCYDRINFENNYIEVSRNLTRQGLSEVTKTHIVRHIPMNEEVRAVLLKQMRSQKCPKFVFVKPNGRPYNPDHFSERNLLPALEYAGIRKVTFHIFRHTFASQFMMNGGNLYDLQKLLGHTKSEMTQKYAHLSPQHLRKAVDVVRFSADGNKSVSPYLALEENQPLQLKVISN